MVLTEETTEEMEDAWWDEITVILGTADGMAGTEEIPVERYMGDPPEGLAAYRMSPGHKGGVLDRVDIGDVLLITGIDERFIGGSVRVLWQGDGVAQVDLPGTFVPTVDVTFWDPVIHPEVFPSTVTWTYQVLVKEYGPDSKALEWFPLQLGIEDAEGTTVEEPRPLLEDRPSSRDDDTDGTEAHPGSPFAMDVGDRLLVSGLARRHEGMTLVLYKGEDPVWSSAPIPHLAFDPVDIDLGNVTMDTIFFNNESLIYWEAFIPVDETPDGDPIWWNNVTLDIKGDELDTIVSGWSIFKDTGTCSSIIALFDDGDTDDGNVTAGDVLRFTGLDLSFRGAQVCLILNDLSAGSRMLPNGFPMENVSVGVRRINIDNRTMDDDVLWDLTVNLSHTYPDNIDLEWEDITLRVINRSSDVVLLALTAPDLYDGTKGDGPEVLYDEASPTDGIVSRSDQIFLFGLDESFEGQSLQVYLSGEHVTNIRLPTPFDRTNLGPVTMNIASPDILSQTINGTYYHKATLNINKITPKDVKVYWDELTIEVKAVDGTVLVPKSPLVVVYSNPNYDEDDTDGIDVELWSIETGGDDKAGAGDSFIISGMTTAFEQAIVYIYAFGKLAGSITLPSNFP
jgi:hypothetical protein